MPRFIVTRHKCPGYDRTPWAVWDTTRAMMCTFHRTRALARKNARTLNEYYSGQCNSIYRQLIRHLRPE